MCHGVFPFYFENMLTANLISMITGGNLHGAQLFVEEIPQVQNHCKTLCVFANTVY